MSIPLMSNKIILPSANYIISQDVAKSVDYSTTEIYQLQYKIIQGSYDRRIFSYLECVFRDKRQMKYTELADYTKELIMAYDLYAQSALIIDATGVGAAVYDIYQERGLHPLGIVYSSGNSDSVKAESGNTRNGIYNYLSKITVPKTDLITSLQLMMQQGRLGDAKGLNYTEEARTQFIHFVGKINEKTGNKKFENDNPAIHDDLVTTAAQACYYALHTDKSIEFNKKTANKKDSYQTNPYNSTGGGTYA